MIRCGLKTGPQYLSGLDLKVGHAGRPCLLAYPQGLNATTLAQSLSKVLRNYPAFTGRLRKDPHGFVYIDGSDQGASFTVHRHMEVMPPYGVNFLVGRDIARYHLSLRPGRVVRAAQPLLAVEVHHFACGGTLLSTTVARSLCDHSAFWNFMQDWVRVHHGHPVAPAPADRNQLVRACEADMSRPDTLGTYSELSPAKRTWLMARVAWQHQMQLERWSFRVSPAQIASWQDQARSEAHGDGLPASHELVAAYCLKALSARMPGQSARHIGQFTDLRHQHLPSIPDRYVGNAMGHDAILANASTLQSASMSCVAAMYRLPNAQQNADKVRSYLGLMARHRLNHTNHLLWERSIAHNLDSCVMVHNGTHLPAYKMNFGTGAPNWVDFGRSLYRQIVLMPSPLMNGGIDVHLTAHKRELAGFDSPRLQSEITHDEPILTSTAREA